MATIAARGLVLLMDITAACIVLQIALEFQSVEQGQPTHLAKKITTDSNAVSGEIVISINLTPPIFAFELNLPNQHYVKN